MADDQQALREVDDVVRKFGVSFKLSLPERGLEWAHWAALPGEAADGGSPGSAEATPPPSSRPPGKLQLSDFELGRLLGEGNYSRVFLGTLRSTGQQLAVKAIEKRKLERYKKQAEPLMEKHILSTLAHPGMIRLHHTFQDPTCLYLVTDFCAGGELWAQSHRAGLRPSLARFYAAELLDVLEYLHSQLVVHRDVKPENVLIDRSGHVKLIDFGTAKIVGEHARETAGNHKFGRHFREFVGTPEYMPPETINNKPGDYRADLWSYGGTLHHLLTGQPPFKGGSEYLTFKRVLARQWRCPVGMPEDGRDLVSSLLQIEPSARLGGGVEAADKHAAIRAHPFFQGVRWENLWEQPVPEATAEETRTVADANAVSALPRGTLPPPLTLPAPPTKRPKAGSRAALELEQRLAALRADYDRDKAVRDVEVARVAAAGAVAAHVRGWDPDRRRRCALHLDVRARLDEEARVALGMPEPEPEIVDDIEPIPSSSDEDEEGAPAAA